MKTKYPKYERGSTKRMKAQLKGEDKKVFQDYINFLSQTAGKRKMIDYEMYFLQFIDIMKPKKVYALEPQDFINFWALVNHDETREVNTKNGIKRTVKRFLEEFYQDNAKMLRTSKKLKLKHQLVNKKKINKESLVSDDELARMLKSTSSIMLKAQLKTLYNSALRPEELRLAKWKAIDWDKKTIRVLSNKTGEPREIPLGDAANHLRRWFKEFCYDDVSDEDYIFPSPRNRNQPYQEWGFRYNVIKMGKYAGIKRTIYPYLLRHTRLNFLRSKGVDTKTRSLFAGHSPKMADGVYNHMDNEDMIGEIENKIYNVEELTEDKQHELEKEIEQMKQQNEKLYLNHLKLQDKIMDMAFAFEELKQVVPVRRK